MRVIRSSVVCVAVALSVLWPMAAAGQPIVVDGVVDAGYGAAVASDPLGDYVGEPAWDLVDLHLSHDADHLYVAFSIAGDVATNPYGKYVLYVDTTGDASGATVDAWQRNVEASDPHKPEYSINTWLDDPPYGTASVEVWAWSGGTWNSQGTVAEAAVGASAGGSVVEWKVARSALGDPQQVWVEVYSTGKETTDNAQDTINAPADDWNAATGGGQWTDKATIACSTPYSLATSPPADSAPPDSGPPDANPPDVAPPPPDVGPADSVAPDQPQVPDSAAPDQLVSDQASGDGASPPADSRPQADGLAVEAGGTDGGSNGQPDAGSAEGDGGGTTGPRQDEGCGCGAGSTGSSSSALVLPVALLVLGRRRRLGR